METLLLFSVLAAALVAAVIFIVRLSGEKSALNSRVMELEKEKSSLEASLASEESAAVQAEKMYQRSVDEIRRLNKEYLDMNSEQHARDLEAMREQFRSTASEIVASNSREFREQSASSIADMLAPIREKFSEFDKSMRDTRTESVRYSSELSASVKLVLEQSRQVGEEARNLADALSGRSKVQGDFGEMLLKDILKNAGLQEGIHFISQGVITDKDGHEVRSEGGAVMIPDTIVFYPDDTMVIVDSKVSLTAFNSFMASSSAEQRKKFAKDHVESVRRHVDELKAKDYASYIPEGKRKVDYNIMFIPVEGAFRLMLEEAPLLWQTAKDNNVLIVSQMTLVIVLNMIQMSWKQAEQEANIEQVYKTASELMGQLQGWMNSFVAVGDNLERTLRSYNESRQKLVDSNQSVVRKIGKLEALGLSPKRSRGKVRISARKYGSESVIPAALSSAQEGTDDSE